MITAVVLTRPASAARFRRSARSSRRSAGVSEVYRSPVDVDFVCVRSGPASTRSWLDIVTADRAGPGRSHHPHPRRVPGLLEARPRGVVRSDSHVRVVPGPAPARGPGILLLLSGLFHRVWLANGAPSLVGPVTAQDNRVRRLRAITTLSLAGSSAGCRARRAAGLDGPRSGRVPRAGDVVIDIQQWRGVASHFNFDTDFDTVVFDRHGRGHRLGRTRHRCCGGRFVRRVAGQP